MASTGAPLRSLWSSKWAFILAAAASAVGLGNLWRFPYLAAKYGGGAFLITYMVLVVTFGFSLMMLEVAIGRKTGQSAIGSVQDAEQEIRVHRLLHVRYPVRHCAVLLRDRRLGDEVRGGLSA